MIYLPLGCMNTFSGDMLIELWETSGIKVVKDGGKGRGGETLEPERVK